jgi:PAS domain-containing protein
LDYFFQHDWRFVVVGMCALVGVAGLCCWLRAKARARDGVLLSMVVNNMTQGVVLIDANERVLVCNDRYVDMYRMSREIVKPGCTLTDLIKNRIATAASTSMPRSTAPRY